MKAHPALFEGEGMGRGGGGGEEPNNEALLFKSKVDIHFQNAHKTLFQSTVDINFQNAHKTQKLRRLALCTLINRNILMNHKKLFQKINFNWFYSEIYENLG